MKMLSNSVYSILSLILMLFVTFLNLYVFRFHYNSETMSFNALLKSKSLFQDAIREELVSCSRKECINCHGFMFILQKASAPTNKNLSVSVFPSSTTD